MDTQLLFSIALLFSALIFLTLKNKSKPKKSTGKLPPGPWKLPVLGNMHNMMAGLAPHRMLHNLSVKYGPVMHLKLGELSVAVIASPEAARQVMKTHDINFASRSSIIVAEIISYGCTSITFSPYGDYWRQLRKIATLEVLSTKRVQSFRPLREQVFGDLTRKFAASGGSPINFSEDFNSATYALISRATLGDRAKEYEALLPMLKELAEMSAGFDIADVFPSIRLFHVMSKLKKRVGVLHKQVDKILGDVIDQHREAAKSAKSEEQSKKHEDMLDVLLKFQGDELDFSLSTDNIKAVLVDMLAGGSETSATQVEWAMSEIIRNPRILKKAQDEVRQLFDDKGYVDETLIPQLPYLKLIVKETLRMHPSLPLLLPRKAGETCEIDGYEIPADAKVIVNGWSINRDPKYWENPNTFEPERFLENSVDFRGSNFEYIPFGAGRRICPGMSFGLANVEYPLALFLYHFDWKLAGGMRPEDLDMEYGTGVTARRRTDLSVVATVTRPLPV